MKKITFALKERLPYYKPKLKFFGKIKDITLGGFTGFVESGNPSGPKKP